MGRHFPVFDHRRDCREKKPLLGRVETIPTRKIEVLAGMLYVILDKPGNRRDVAVPRPTGFLGMAVDAGVGKYVRYGRSNFSAR